MQSISLPNVSPAQKMHPSEALTNRVGLLQHHQHQVPPPAALVLSGVAAGGGKGLRFAEAAGHGEHFCGRDWSWGGVGYSQPNRL